MKKFLIQKFPLLLAAVTLLIVTAFLRYNLYISSQQLIREFQTQNAKELYSIDTLKISTRLNSMSSAINWVCIEAEARENVFFKMQKGDCSSGIFQQRSSLYLPEADNIKVSFTLKLPGELQKLFIIFIILQIASIFAIIFATKKAEVEKLKKETELYELSRRMFHDIRSPLASLNEVADQIGDTNSQEFRILKNSINRINEIANSLLEQTIKSTAVSKPSFNSLSTLIDELIDEKIVEKKIDINLSGEIGPKGFIIPSDFKRIFSNLINNAIEASDKKIPKVKISLNLVADKILIDIEDNGSGIPDSILKKLGTAEITSKPNGNGIGFKNSMELLKEWQGDLRILSTGPQGTKVRIEILADVSKSEELEIKDQPLSLTVLIDDDDLTRMTWEMKAKKTGLNLKTFSNIESFKTDMDSIPKTAVLYIDSELGEIKGEELATELYHLGFTDISMASGHPPERFAEYKFLRSVISKKAPF